jgi:hypothetical protein
MVTARMSTPLIAVETNSRPEGSSRKATGAPRHLAGGAADGAAGVRAGRERAHDAAERAHAARVVAQGVVDAARVALVGLALELVGEHAGEHREELLVVRRKRPRLGRERGEAPTRAPSESSSGTPR